jgi:outer membrane protein assembly factor BamD (BamD/ComL family)
MLWVSALSAVILIADAMPNVLESDREHGFATEAPAKAMAPGEYQKKAAENYRLARDLLGRGLGIESGSAFLQVQQKYPFSRFAVLAELGWAEALALQGKPEEAVAAFTRFIEQHPGHPMAKDARYGIVTTLWVERPSDFFLLPVPHERDLQDVFDTQRAGQVFLRIHGDDKRVEEVRKILTEARRMVFRKGLYLARWTAEHGTLKAAIWRAEALVARDPDLAEEAKFGAWLDGLRARLAAEPKAVDPEPPLFPEAPALAVVEPPQ